MIGNDVVDLALAKIESNWQRSRFLAKIFTKKEQEIIFLSDDQELMVWNLWSMKEAAYKIYNRETGIRGYFPLEIECVFNDFNSGNVVVKGNKIFTQTSINNNQIHTVAVAEKEYFAQIKPLSFETKIIKINRIPFVMDGFSKKLKPVSISHHGEFWKGITI
jgi:phosphopantetheine--protein transferase-like protein